MKPITIDICNVPFSRYGAFMAISYLTSDFRLFGQDLHLTDGLYLRSLRGDTMMQPIVGKLVPTVNGIPAEYTYHAEACVLTVTLAEGHLRFTYANPFTLLIEGYGDGVGFKIDEIDKGGVFDFIHEIPVDDRLYYELNLYKNQDKFICGAIDGDVSMKQKWEEKTASDCSVLFQTANDHLLAAVEEAKQEWTGRAFSFDFGQALASAEAELEEFIEKLPSVPQDCEEDRRVAGYILWGNTVQADTFLTRDAVYASKNWMLGAFSWDQCFPAMALAYGHPGLAWDQLLLLFDYQVPSGRIPDYVMDTNAHWNYSKPPIHGWTLMRMMEHMTLSDAQKQEAYTRLSAWTEWWYSYRDSDHDGCCEYYHGNDSGWDNATVFRKTPTVETPDLSAFLALQMEALANLAKELGRDEESENWIKRSEKQIADMLRHNFRNHFPTTFINRTHEEVESDSLLPYLCILLGNRLPAEEQKTLSDTLKNDGFLTPFGIATEKTKSSLYHPDGYWRGPIWAPSTVIMLDGLWQLGEKELVRQIARGFVSLIKKSGFAENFDALTGEGRRDRAYSWTAAAFLIIAHEYLQES